MTLIGEETESTWELTRQSWPDSLDLTGTGKSAYQDITLVNVYVELVVFTHIAGTA